MTQSQILWTHSFTCGLSPEHINSLAALAELVEFGHDELILVTGEQSKAFYLVWRGRVAIELRTPLFSLRVQTIGPGEAFGWSALLDEHDTLFHVRALESCIALRLDGPRLRVLCQADPQLGSILLYRIVHLVAERVKATEEQVASLCGVQANLTNHQLTPAPDPPLQ